MAKHTDEIRPPTHISNAEHALACRTFYIVPPIVWKHIQHVQYYLSHHQAQKCPLQHQKDAKASVHSLVWIYTTKHNHQ